MESDKENNFKTKIPIPRKPLPALPPYLLKDNRNALKEEKITNRIPLQTINANNSPQPGPSKNTIQASFPINLHTSHITLRSRNKGFDGNYHVFKDPATENYGISLISDDEEINENKHSNILEAIASSGTPSVNLSIRLEKSQLRNIKRSLKRPHSRELQGLSPLNEKDQFDNKVKRRLHFNELVQSRLQSVDYCDKSYFRDFDDVYTKDIFEHLNKVEKKTLGVPKISSVTRACVINWLLKVNGTNGESSTIQTASWYFDCLLSTGAVPLNKLQLVASACYWISQKLHGRAYSAARLVKCANEAFTTTQLLRAEKIVLIKLDFPPQPVVAQDYITYLAWYCEQTHRGEIEEAATFLSLCGLIVDKTLCDEYPSAIAAVAIRSAITMLRKSELMCRLKKCAVYKAAQEKVTKSSSILSLFCAAVRTVAASSYEYKTLIQLYSTPPRYTAQKILNAVNEL